jgi:hypothetical protein
MDHNKDGVLSDKDFVDVREGMQNWKTGSMICSSHL